MRMLLRRFKVFKVRKIVSVFLALLSVRAKLGGAGVTRARRNREKEMFCAFRFRTARPQTTTTDDFPQLCGQG